MGGRRKRRAASDLGIGLWILTTGARPCVTCIKQTAGQFSVMLQKNDDRDAEATAEAATRPGVPRYAGQRNSAVPAITARIATPWTTLASAFLRQTANVPPPESNPTAFDNHWEQGRCRAGP